MFSRRLFERVQVESREGFSYSLELLVKCHRLGWPITEVPAQWHERTVGKSRFRVLRWLPAYLQWYCYAFATTYLRHGSSSVPEKSRGKKSTLHANGVPMKKALVGRLARASSHLAR